jgi:hypothetical protein
MDKEKAEEVLDRLSQENHYPLVEYGDDGHWHDVITGERIIYGPARIKATNPDGTMKVLVRL